MRVSPIGDRDRLGRAGVIATRTPLDGPSSLTPSIRRSSAKIGAPNRNSGSDPTSSFTTDDTTIWPPAAAEATPGSLVDREPHDIGIGVHDVTGMDLDPDRVGEPLALVARLDVHRPRRADLVRSEMCAVSP